MSSESEIVCRPTKWFLWRAALMLVMFGGFGAYFLYDWKIGYPEKNYIVANYQAFSAAGKVRSENDDLKGQESWEAFVDSQIIPFEEEPKMYPAGTDFEEKWPKILYQIGEKNSTELWKDYSEEKGWPQNVDPSEDVKPLRKISEQLIAAAVCFVLLAVVVFFLIRTRGRSMKVDDKGYYAPGGPFVAFGDMVTIDKRKWETKGLAIITYKDGEEEKKAKVDGMVYGQFREEDGAPAEALFQRILANFNGELIELVIEDEDEEEEADSPEEPVEADGEEKGE